MIRDLVNRRSQSTSPEHEQRLTECGMPYHLKLSDLLKHIGVKSELHAEQWQRWQITVGWAVVQGLTRLTKKELGRTKSLGS